MIETNVFHTKVLRFLIDCATFKSEFEHMANGEETETDVELYGIANSVCTIVQNAQDFNEVRRALFEASRRVADKKAQE